MNFFYVVDCIDEIAQQSQVFAKLKELDLSQNSLHEFSVYLLRYAQNLTRLDLFKVTFVINVNSDVFHFL